MIDNIVKTLKTVMGWEQINLIFIMSIRGIILYTLAVISIRLNKKLLGIRTAYSFILFVMLGSLCAAAITNEGLFFPITFAILVLSIINKIVANLFFNYPSLETFFTGKPVLLINNGQVQWSNMQKHFITEIDLLNALQTQLHTSDFTKVEAAYLATDGTINFIRKI